MICMGTCGVGVAYCCSAQCTLQLEAVAGPSSACVCLAPEASHTRIAVPVLLCVMHLLCTVWGCNQRLWLVHHLPVFALLQKLLTRALLSHPFFASCICQKICNPPEAALFPSAEVPGLPRKHLAAQLDNESGVLIISGSYPADPAASTTETILQERRHEEFRREFRLPEDVAIEGISAKLDNGELTGEHPLPGSACHCLNCSWPAPHVHCVCVLASLLSILDLAMPPSPSSFWCSCCFSDCTIIIVVPFSPCLATLATATTSPTLTLPAVSLPKIAKPELTTIPILGDDNIPAPVVEASAPTKPDAAAPRSLTDKEAAPMEEDHEVISLVALLDFWRPVDLCACFWWACAAQLSSACNWMLHASVGMCSTAEHSLET